MRTVNVVLLGVYDSRGGTFAVEADSIEEACEIMNGKDFFVDELSELDCKSMAEDALERAGLNKKKLVVKLSGDLPLYEEDLEIDDDGNDTGRVLVENGNLVYYKEDEVTEAMREQKPHWDDDAFSFLFVPKPHFGFPLVG